MTEPCDTPEEIIKNCEKMRRKLTFKIATMLWVSGYFCHMTFMILYENWLGKEKYIQTVQDNWISGLSIVPIAIGIIVATLMIYVKYRNKIYQILTLTDNFAQTLFIIKDINNRIEREKKKNG